METSNKSSRPWIRFGSHFFVAITVILLAVVVVPSFLGGSNEPEEKAEFVRHCLVGDGREVGQLEQEYLADTAFGNLSLLEPERDEIPPDTGIVIDNDMLVQNMEELWEDIGYPPMAREAEIEGRVVLRVLMDENGNYLQHKTIKSPHPILDHTVIKHIKKLKMNPGMLDGQPVKAWATTEFDFVLHP